MLRPGTSRVFKLTFQTLFSSWHIGRNLLFVSNICGVFHSYWGGLLVRSKGLHQDCQAAEKDGVSCQISNLQSLQVGPNRLLIHAYVIWMVISDPPVIQSPLLLARATVQIFPGKKCRLCFSLSIPQWDSIY